jgi:hypothetical protein
MYSACLLLVGTTRSVWRTSLVSDEPEYWKLSIPLKSFEPDFVMTLTMPPSAPP